MTKSLCTDREYWRHLDKSEEKDSHICSWCTQSAEGRLCKKTMAQIYFQARHLSNHKAACRFVLLFEFSDLKKKEKKAFIKAYELARSWYDQQVQNQLLFNHRFHQNAKVIEDIKRTIIAGNSSNTQKTVAEELSQLAEKLPL
jgi:hypothetical protein